ncbi:hypothetical protein CPB85DRAFT_1440075 [Mucidula mucida]|nr:hypothetical protein CPB85DRAFT_1440075 [Mucidula mucida]
MLHDIPECYICWYQMLPDKANSSEGPRVASREYLHSLRDKFADRSLGDTMRTPMSSTSGDSIMRFGRYEGTALKDMSYGLESPSASKAGSIWTARVPKSDKTLRLYARPHVFASTQHSVDFTYDDIDCGYEREIIATELEGLLYPPVDDPKTTTGTTVESDSPSEGSEDELSARLGSLRIWGVRK